MGMGHALAGDHPTSPSANISGPTRAVHPQGGAKHLADVCMPLHMHKPDHGPGKCLLHQSRKRHAFQHGCEPGNHSVLWVLCETIWLLDWLSSSQPGSLDVQAGQAVEQREASQPLMPYA